MINGDKGASSLTFAMMATDETVNHKHRDQRRQARQGEGLQKVEQ